MNKYATTWECVMRLTLAAVSIPARCPATSARTRAAPGNRSVMIMEPVTKGRRNVSVMMVGPVLGVRSQSVTAVGTTPPVR